MAMHDSEFSSICVVCSFIITERILVIFSQFPTDIFFLQLIKFPFIIHNHQQLPLFRLYLPSWFKDFLSPCDRPIGPICPLDQSLL